MNTRAMLDQSLSGAKLRRGTSGGESDSMRGGGVLDPDSKLGRNLRLTGHVVGKGNPAGVAPDQMHHLMSEAGLIGHGASVDDAVETYSRLARQANQEDSKAHRTRMARAEAQHAEETYVAPPAHLQPRQFTSNPHGRSEAERMGLDF